MPLPRGWNSSVGLGIVENRPAAWLLAGNFRFARGAAKHEAAPSVPLHRVLISIGDFPILDHSTGWRHVRRLRLPGRSGTSRVVSWRARFARRALLLRVRFGSRPDARSRRLVNRRLATIHRTD